VRVLLACDLDGTLIYSRRAVGADASLHELTCVEEINGVPASFMTEGAATGLATLSKVADVVPVSTRSPDQFARLRLPTTSGYAVLANGGLLFVDGRLDPAWSAVIAARLRATTPFDEVWRHVHSSCDPQWTTKIRRVDELFCYAVLDRDRAPEAFLLQERAWASARGWRTSLQGRKLFWVPAALTKAAAVAEIADRGGAEVVLAAGDALLDSDLLEYADLGVFPSHGELADTQWSAPGVSQVPGRGVVGGQQIVEWLADAVAATAAGGGAVARS
jgi:hydroxymethylpyrimidine pyrophosphatase-like HAD family hydrolase